MRCVSNKTLDHLDKRSMDSCNQLKAGPIGCKTDGTGCCTTGMHCQGHLGKMLYWINGTKDERDEGTMRCVSKKTLDHLDKGSMDSWNQLNAEAMEVGPMGHMTTYL